MLSLSCNFAGWTRQYYWCIAVYSNFFHPRHYAVPCITQDI